MKPIVCPDCSKTLFVTQAFTPGKETEYKVECLNCGFTRSATPAELGIQS